VEIGRALCKECIPGQKGGESKKEEAVKVRGDYNIETAIVM
jgi:hypothetical protein